MRNGHDVVAELEALVAAHPLDEPLAALLMRALAERGSPGQALEVYEAIRQRLADTLGTDPTAELTGLHLELLRAEPPARGNLPAEVSSFVGRDADVREVRDLVARHRLVTLLGPGGSGKTRLSVEAGAGVPGEVWQVELAPVTDPAEIPAAVLTALGMRNQVLLARPARPGAVHETVLDPLTRLRDGLAGKHLLLILDNCEHLIGAAARVAEALLRAAPGLRVLATSREPLGIPGERLYPVEPLALPPDGRRRGHRVRLPGGAAAAGPGARVSSWTPARSARWCGSAVRWTACRWPSNWPPRGCARCRWTCWPTGWPTGSGCSPAAAARRCPGTGRCARWWTGAGICCPSRNASCGGGSRCSTAVPT